MTLRDHNLTSSEFKKKYPRVYNKIIKQYGGRDNIFDVQAAIEMWMRGEPAPQCEICSESVSITKKFRLPQPQVKCKRHTNTRAQLTISDLLPRETSTVSVVRNLPSIFTPSTIITLDCAQHGQYQQKASYFLNGGQCQQCYHENKGPRVSFTQWAAKSSKIHSNKYTYTESSYVSLDHNTTISCPTHGEFAQNAGVHSRGHGCPKCANNMITEKLRITNEEFIEKCINKHGAIYDYSKTEYVSILHGTICITCKKHGDFMQRPGDHLNGGHGCPKCAREIHNFKSAPEYEIIDFLKSHGITNIVHSDHHLGIELDIFLPDFNLAIEYNGIYWHSSGSRDSDLKLSKQHLYKTEMCERNGITLLHIFELEWTDSIKQEIWKSTILHKLGLSTNRIYARKCGIVLVPHNIATDFFTENHLQGPAASAICIGLQYDGKLVAAGSFAKPRFTKEPSAFELIRFASQTGTSVIGGFQKIIKAFGDTHQGVLISYANRRWSLGNVYKQSGFELDSVSSPCYYYTDCKTLWHRTKFQKHKLKHAIAVFDPNLTEVDNMYNNKYRRIWDCGHMVFKLKLQ